MSRRPGVITSHYASADGGVSPNAFHPVITVEVRCFWPPLATLGEVHAAMHDAYVKAVAEVEAEHERVTRR